MMDEKFLSLVVNTGVASERREACEWLSLKSQVEEKKFRQLSADLERRRRRKFNCHLEERKKVENELDNLQKDQKRFEREKQLRRRKLCSSAKSRKHAFKSQKKEKKIDFPIKENALGGSASIAFDPKVEKYSRREKKTKLETFKRKEKGNDFEDARSATFPYLTENDIIKVHQNCKSAVLRDECRRWGAAWLYAKKEQDLTPNKEQRWNTLLLNAEKEKMRALCQKWKALKDRQNVNSESTQNSAAQEKYFYNSKKRSENGPAYKEERENSASFNTISPNSNLSAEKATKSDHSNNVGKIFTSPFSKGIAMNVWSLNQDAKRANSSTHHIIARDRKDESKQAVILEVIQEGNSEASPNLNKCLQKNKNSGSFLPEL